MTVWVVVVAAGSGNRFGGLKQYEMLGNARVVDHSIATAREAADGVVVVVSADRLGDERRALAQAGADIVVAGGASRSDSVRCGLAALPADATVVLVHDGARPLASAAIYERVLDAVARGADAAVPAVDVVDSLRRRDGGAVDREALVAVQTPQGFSADALRRAHRGAPDASDDATLVEVSGGEVVIVPGERTNIKITTPNDLLCARALLQAERI